jgi:anti-anti-sigma regulatory factor
MNLRLGESAVRANDRPNRIQIMRPRGSLDRVTVDGILNQWLTIIDRDKPDVVTIDLGAIGMLDGCGLRMLHLLHICLAARGVSCRLRGAGTCQGFEAIGS